MKPVILAVLLLLVITSIVSGDTTESGEVSGDTTTSGKSWYGHKACLPVILHTVQIHTFVSLLNYELRLDAWRNESKTPGILVPTLEAKVQLAY
jgi:hypothetical protein